MKNNQIATQLDNVLSEYGNAALEEIKGEVKAKVDEQIQSVANKVQKKFIDNIGDDLLRDASTKTLKKVAKKLPAWTDLSTHLNQFKVMQVC